MKNDYSQLKYEAIWTLWSLFENYVFYFYRPILTH